MNLTFIISVTRTINITFSSLFFLYLGRHMVAMFIQSYKVMYKEEGQTWRYYTIDEASPPRVIHILFYFILF